MHHKKNKKHAEKVLYSKALPYICQRKRDKTTIQIVLNTNTNQIERNPIMKYTHYVLAGLVGISFTLTGCVSKKDLLACQENNNLLNSQYQTTKEQLAVANSRVTSLEEQLAQAKKDYALLQQSLDKSLTNANQNNISIDKLVSLNAKVTCSLHVFSLVIGEETT